MEEFRAYILPPNRSTHSDVLSNDTGYLKITSLDESLLFLLLLLLPPNLITHETHILVSKMTHIDHDHPPPTPLMQGPPCLHISPCSSCAPITLVCDITPRV